MTSFSFKARFCQPIIDGTKGGTIRAPRKDGRLPPIGGALQFYTAMRTRQCRKIRGDLPCLGVTAIRFTFGGIAGDPMSMPTVAFVDRSGGKEVGWYFHHPKQLDAFAVFDGFGDWADLRAFWEAEHGAVTMFDGFHTRWLPWPKALVP